MDVLETVLQRRNPVIFDRRDRFVFFPNNKVCQVSVTRAALRYRVVVRKVDEAGWDRRSRALDEDYLDRVFTFTIVRNPFDRAVSAFTYLQGIRLIPAEFAFAPFCKEVLSAQGFDFDPHFDPQVDGLVHGGRHIVDFVARFEHIDEDWRTIAEQIGANQRFPHRNRSRRGRDYAAYYDDESRRVVAWLYRDDLAHFGYDFGGGMPAS